MADLHFEKTSNTPKVDFLSNDGILQMEGRSIPENPAEFYKPLFDWATEYFTAPQKITRLLIKLEYINSGSSKSLLEFLRLIKEFVNKGNQCVIEWYYEEDDESLLDLGEHYQHTLKIPFEFKTY